MSIEYINVDSESDVSIEDAVRAAPVPIVLNDFSIADQLFVASKRQEISRSRVTRKEMGDAERQWLFDEAQKKPVRRASVVLAEFKKHFGRTISEASFRRYRSMTVEDFQAQGHRGRHDILQEKEKKLLLAAFAEARSTGFPVTAAVFASIAIGVVERNRKGSTTVGGGCLKFSLSWAKKFMNDNDIRVRHATTDRTICSRQAIETANKFFAELKQQQQSCGGHYTEDLTFNVDEFFLNLSGTQTWTWERVQRGERKNISVSQPKAGVSCAVVSNAAGSIVLMQFIYKGVRIKVDVSDIQGAEALIMQCNRAESHFQDASTWAEMCDRFITIVQRKLADAGDHTARALLLIDAAPQHDYEKTKEKLAQHRCDVVRVPPKMTHVLQPADQFIIANIKSRSMQLWNESIAELFKDNEKTAAVKTMTSSSITICRERKVRFITTAALELGPASIKKSWLITGIPECLWGVRYDGVTRVQALQKDASQLDELRADFSDTDSGADGVDDAPAPPQEAQQVAVTQAARMAQRRAQDEGPTSPQAAKRGRPKYDTQGLANAKKKTETDDTERMKKYWSQFAKPKEHTQGT